MATDRLINQTQGEDIIDQLHDIATNVGNITYGPQTSADKVVSMTGYAKAPAEAAISQGDTLNEAIGKLEKKADDNATAVADKIDKLTSATAGDIATVTATGEIADSAVAIETTLSDSSDAKVPTSKAVGTYVDGKGYAVGVSSSTANNLVAFNSTDGKALKDSGIAVATSTTGLADSDTAVPTSKTVKTYVDSTATGISRYLGTITAASGLSTSAKKGDFYIVKTAWTGVHVGDEIIAEKNSPSQTIDGTNWSLLHNEADTDTKYTFATGEDNGTFKVTPSDTGTAQSVPIKGLGSTAYTTADTSSLTNDNNHVPTSALAKTLLDAKVPTARKVNNKALSSDITLSASDVSAVPTGNVTTALPASSAAASTSKVMSEKLVYDTYVPNSDFVVAKQNIAYVSNQIGKNSLNIENITGATNATYTSTKTSVTITSTGTYGNIRTKTHLKTGKYVWSCDVSNLSAYTGESPYITMYVESGGSDIAPMGITSNGNKVSTVFTISTEADYYFYIYARRAGSTDNTLTVSNLMLCTEEAWNISHAYDPYALPNSDLTRLEVEDRVALAEEIDAGAKNKLDCNVSTLIPLNTYGSWSGSTYSINSGTTSFVVNSTLTITASKSDTGTARSMTFANYTDGSVLNGMVISGGTSNVTIIVQKNGGNYETYATSEGSGALISGIAANTAVRIVASIASAVTCSNVVIQPMLCTKAAFGVSSKFVPYRPNWDLVGLRLTNVENWINSRFVPFATLGAQIRSFAIRRLKGTTNSRIPIHIAYSSQANGHSVVSLDLTLLSNGGDNNTPMLSLVGIYTSVNTSNVAVYYKLDTTNQICYVSMKLHTTHLWASGYLQYVNSLNDEIIFDFDTDTDISSDPVAVKLDLYAPTMTLLS